MTNKQIELIKKKSEEYLEKSRILSLRERETTKIKNKKLKKKKSKPHFKIKPAIKKYKNYKEYLLSSEWKSKRLKVLKQANYICEICGMKKAYQVHHKHYKNIYHEKLSDLIATCGVCHQAEHNLLSEDQIEKAINDLMIKGGVYLK